MSPAQGHQPTFSAALPWIVCIAKGFVGWLRCAHLLVVPADCFALPLGTC